jgi:hypothetical protein
MLKDFRIRYLILFLAVCCGYGLLLLMDEINIFHVKTFCIFKNLTGYPCPGCGMGRSMLCLYHGNLSKALWYNSLSIPFLICTISGLIWMIIDIFRNKETFIPFLKKDVNWFWKIILFLVIIGNWAWNIYKGL